MDNNKYKENFDSLIDSYILKIGEKTNETQKSQKDKI